MLPSRGAVQSGRSNGKSNKPAKARAAFSIPEGFEPMTAIAVGYVGDPETLPEKNRNQELAPRTRKPLGEFVFGDTWDTPNPVVVAPPAPIN